MNLKKLYVIASVALVTASSALAQQLPNNGFEEEWVPCIPWTSADNKIEMGTTPTGWNVSNVVNNIMSSVKAIEAAQIDHLDGKAVQLKNTGILGNNIPAYMSLGTSWSTAKGIKAENKDGGTFGGIEFVYRPDALQFDYVRKNGSGSNQPATVVFYSWKGTTEQANVPGQISNNPVVCPKMINRERNILDMTPSTGGEVTKSSDFALVSKLQFEITEPTADWQTILKEIDYFSSDIPEMANAIFAANAYFDASNVKKDDELDVDNVKLIYYSRLSDIKVNGATVDGFDANKYEYTVDVPYSDDILVAYNKKGQSAEVKPVEYDAEKYTATIRVSNVDADTDGLKEHTYVIQFAKPQEPVTPTIPEAEDNSAVFAGEITIDMGEPMTLPDQYVKIKSTGVNPETNGDMCEFRLEHFSLDGESDMGDIIVKDVLAQLQLHDNSVAYKGSVDNLTLDMGGMPIYAGADIEGSEDEDGNLVMNIHVKWYYNRTEPQTAMVYAQAEEEEHIPIEVVFNGKVSDDKRQSGWVTGIEDIVAGEDGTAVRYFLINGLEVNEAPSTGLYIELRGNKARKVLAQ